MALDLTEEEGASLGQVIAAFLVAERLLDLDKLWAEIEQASLPEAIRIELFSIAASSVRSHLSDILRSVGGETRVSTLCKLLEPGVRKIATAATKLIRAEVRNEAARAARPADRHGRQRRDRPRPRPAVRARRRVRPRRARRGRKIDELALTIAYTRLGEALGLDWAQQQVARFVPGDQWERLLTAGLARDFEQLRIDFLARRRTKEPDVAVDHWVASQGPRIAQFRNLLARARAEGAVSAPMLAQIASQARILLAR